MKKIVSPTSILIEKTALQMAAEFYEIGRSQGLTSKHKNARHFAAHNMEKFVPHAIQSLRELLYKDSTPNEMRAIIHDAILERINDADANSLAKAAEGRLPEIDISKIIPVKDIPSVIVDQRRQILK